MRPIDADELLKELDRHTFDFGLDDLHMLEDVINAMPTVDSEKNKDWKVAYDNLLVDYIKLKRDNEQKHAEWLINSDGYYPYCSNCKEVPKGGMSDYCPKCGAKMKNEQRVQGVIDG